MSKYNYNDGGFTTLFKLGIIGAVFLGVFIGIYNFLDRNSDFFSENDIAIFYGVISVLSTIFIVLYLRQRTKLNNKISELTKELSQANKLKLKLEKTISDLKVCLDNKDRLYESYKSLNVSYISSLYSDFLTLEYSLSADWLENKEIIVKHNPDYYTRVKVGRTAKKSADIVSELRKETKRYIEQSKIMLYKYEALLSLFPELKNYVDDLQTIKELGNFKNIDDFKEEYDKVIDFVSKEDYLKLNVNERNQLALERYIKGKKTNWQIGRDYEMYCSHIYEKDGWNVERFGIEKRLNDMGRDIIASKGDVVHIIQCKYWSQEKLIHEKHIAQLFGSTIEYSISIETNLFKPKVMPVFITNIELSETAKKFAKRLNVLICQWKFNEFPRIKCNINSGEKIYHLPFDQQYDRTQIKNEGEFYAYTIKEATSKGFKRANRHMFS